MRDPSESQNTCLYSSSVSSDGLPENEQDETLIMYMFKMLTMIWHNTVGYITFDTTVGFLKAFFHDMVNNRWRISDLAKCSLVGETPYRGVDPCMDRIQGAACMAFPNEFGSHA